MEKKRIQPVSYECVYFLFLFFGLNN